MKFNFLLHANGYLRTRESSELEYKQSFNASSIPLYLRTLAGMANNKGGQIIFGVKNSPHEPIGLQSTRFNDLDPAEITRRLTHYFEPVFDIGMEILEFNGSQFGQLWVEQAFDKPIVCKANDDKNKLREAAIYFRYRGETKEIGYPELAHLIKAEKEKEQKIWMAHIQKMSEVGPRNISLLDSKNGEISIGEGRIVLDEEILKTINFIKEGRFVEKEGAPAYILKGEVSGVNVANVVVPSDDLYPLFAKDICKELLLNHHQLQCILTKLKIKGDRRYHTSHKTGAKSEVHKYARGVVAIINRKLAQDGFLELCIKEYKK